MSNTTSLNHKCGCVCRRRAKGNDRKRNDIICMEIQTNLFVDIKISPDLIDLILKDIKLESLKIGSASFKSDLTLPKLNDSNFIFLMTDFTLSQIVIKKRIAQNF